MFRATERGMLSEGRGRAGNEGRGIDVAVIAVNPGTGLGLSFRSVLARAGGSAILGAHTFALEHMAVDRPSVMIEVSELHSCRLIPETSRLS